MMEKLPEKWVINRNLNIQLIGEWFNNNNIFLLKGISPTINYATDKLLGDYLHYPNRPNVDNCHSHRIKDDGYVEITLDQFKKFVLKQNVKPLFKIYI